MQQKALGVPPTLVSLLGVVCFWIGCATPDPEVSLQSLYGATDAASCEFSSVVYLRHSTGYCSATLVHPRFVITAAHCVGPTFIGFGEDAGALRRTVNIESCATHPSYATDDNFDYQVCRLVESVDDVPIVPMLAPCELTAIEADYTPLVAVGFGAPAPARKRWRDVLGTRFFDNFLRIDSGLGPGDSGGPTFVRLSDGTWRQAGIHHRESGDVIVTNALAFFESASGVDLSPCARSDGTLEHGVSCGGFPTVLRRAGAWPGCVNSPVGPHPSQTCGPAPIEDAGASVVDAGASVVDAGASVIDAGASVVDAGASVVDAGASVVDAGALVVDAGASVVDAGVSVVDAGSVTLDAGSVTLDAGSAMVDAGHIADAASPDALISPDSGTSVSAIRGGCECHIASRSSAPSMPAIVFACGCVVAIGWRRRRTA